MSAYNPVYKIQIDGTNDGEVGMIFSFNPYCSKISNAELNELISVAKKLQETLKILREVTTSQVEAQATE